MKVPLTPLTCTTGTPISWLRLEQHHDGALSVAEHAAVDEHLAACAACAACAASIVEDEGVALPPLVLPRATVSPEHAPSNLRSLVRRAAPIVAALAVAAALWLVLRRPGERHGHLDPQSDRTKGGGIAFSLVRDRDDRADEALMTDASGIYRDGDRWKALVTCPASMHAAWDLVVYERGEPAFPLEPVAALECGNQVPLRGAFRTTGRESMTVCLVWNEGALVDRAALRGAVPATLPRSTCKVLDPAP